MDQKKKRDLKRKGNSICMVLCLIVLVAAVAAGGIQAYKKHQANLRYEELRAQMEEEEAVEEEEPAVPVETPVTIPIDFDALWKQYPDAYAWITIPDTQVDYPVMQSPDDLDEDYYLDHTIDGDENLPGAIYTQRSWNNKDMTDAVTVIYGHNMRNDSMFGSLSEYKDAEYREAHPYIYIYTPEHILKYQVFGAVTYNNAHILSRYDCNNSEEGYEEFLGSLKKEGTSSSWISEDVPVTVKDKIILLSTCNSNDEQRFLICGVLVEEQ